MKKAILFLAAALMAVTGVQAQKKVAYLDLYQRGGGQNLRTTIMYDSQRIYMGRRNMGEMLNILALQGWEVDQTMLVQRIWTVGMRHKFHIILKKEYNEGENPYADLRKELNFRRVISEYPFRDNSTQMLLDEAKIKEKPTKIKEIPAQQVVVEKPARQYQIAYTTTNGQIASYTHAKETDVENIYVDNQGVLFYNNKSSILWPYMFEGCKNLNTVYIPDNITEIGYAAFSDCLQLRSVHLGKGVQTISGMVFMGCSSLSDIYCTAPNPSAFKGQADMSIPRKTTIHVPHNLVETYKAAKGWKRFKIVGE